MEAADDIAYMTADVEDAVKSEILSVSELLSFLKETYQELGREMGEADVHIAKTEEVIKKLEQLYEEESDDASVMSIWSTYLRKWLMYVSCWRFSKSYNDIVNGKFDYDLFNHSLTAKLLKKAMKEFVFDSKIIVEPEVSAQNILNFLLDKFVPAVVRFDGFGKMTTQDKKVISLISPNHIEDYFKIKQLENISDDGELLYHRILIATDFISGMTDGYAKSLYRKMSGIE